MNSMPSKTILAAMALTVVLGGCADSDDSGQAADMPVGSAIVMADVGFATPESVLHDEVADVYLVSNINGHPLEADGNGFISRVSPDGEVLDLRWIDGELDGMTLSAPKGMAIVGDVLFVTDIDAVRLFDRVTGGPLGEIVIDGATFLNDLAPASDGGVYVTDSGFELAEDGQFGLSGSDAVYHIAPNGDVHTLLADQRLGGPNGVLEVDGEVWVVTFRTGEIFRVAGGERADVTTIVDGSLDGLVLVGDRMLVSNWASQQVQSGAAGEEFTSVMDGVQSPADIGYDEMRNVLLVPLFELNEVRIVPL